MTDLSVNLNKIALLRNSRGRDYPSVVGFAEKFIALGVQGITIHPRPDERHIKRQDARDLADYLQAHDQVALNIEGYPNEAFLRLIDDIRPHQCTLVPDGENQLTSDHGWDFQQQSDFIKHIVSQVNQWKVRTAVFLDADIQQVILAAESGCKRIELYTEDYATAFAQQSQQTVLVRYHEAALKAQELGVGVNAGHDLDLQNLAQFLTIPNVLEVSIGHALTIESIELGMPEVIRRYLDICHD